MSAVGGLRGDGEISSVASSLPRPTLPDDHDHCVKSVTIDKNLILSSWLFSFNLTSNEYLSQAI